MRIPRFLVKIFGNDALPSELPKFGSMAIGRPEFTKDVNSMQSNEWLKGWGGAALNGVNPTREDTNTIQFVNSTLLAYLYQRGIAEYDPEETYYIGSIVNDGRGNIFKSTVNNNKGNDVLDGSFFVNILNEVAGFTHRLPLTRNPQFIPLAQLGVFREDLTIFTQILGKNPNAIMVTAEIEDGNLILYSKHFENGVLVDGLPYKTDYTHWGVPFAGQPFGGILSEQTIFVDIFLR